MDAGVSFAFVEREASELLFGEVEELMDERLGKRREAWGRLGKKRLNGFWLG